MISLPKLPHWCLMCDRKQSQRVCQDCQDLISKPLIQCQQCALPIGEPGTCGQCLQTQPAFDHALCAYFYEAPIDKMIHQFKFQRDLITGRWLAQQLAEHLALNKAQADLLIPTPLHWRRQWTRGFNQSALLAKVIGQSLSITQYPAVKKHKHTPMQHQLSKHQRQKNLKASFVVKNPEMIIDKHVAIIDDVLTTGTTAHTLAQHLKVAGAKTVSIWAIARAC